MEIVLPVRDVFEYCREPPGAVRAVDVERQARSVPHDDANITVDDNGTLVEDHSHLPSSHTPTAIVQGSGLRSVGYLVDPCIFLIFSLRRLPLDPPRHPSHLTR